MLYDVFISHASEDKDSLVRPLAQRLKQERLEVWYDEFSLRPGDSLRRSIDRGLSKSRHGIVVLSQSFFQKNWPQWELDGLVQRQLAGAQQVIIPIWHGVTRSDVLSHSPSLADLVAIDSAQGLDGIVADLLAVVRPEGSTLLVARDRMIEIGFEPPVVTDDWWLDVIEWSASNDSEGTFQEDMGWGRWGFPFSPRGSSSPSERGERLAWAGLQMLWQAEADRRQICQITPPAEVHAFIESQPGMLERSLEFPWFVAAYAPQLTIRGFGGPYENFFDDWLSNSMEKQIKEREAGSRGGSGLTVNGLAPACAEAIALRHPSFGDYGAPKLASWFAGNTDPATGPQAQFLDVIDYVAWFLSEKSNWLPPDVHAYLFKGFAEWAVWPWHNDQSPYSGYQAEAETGMLVEQLFKARSFKSFRFTRAARADLTNRLQFASQLLMLPESGSSLTERFVRADLVRSWFEARGRRSRKNVSRKSRSA